MRGDRHWEDAEVKVTKRRHRRVGGMLPEPGSCPSPPHSVPAGEPGGAALVSLLQPLCQLHHRQYHQGPEPQSHGHRRHLRCGGPPLWAGFRFPLGGWKCSHSGPHLSPVLVPPLSIFQGGATPVGACWIPLGCFWKQVKRGQHCRMQEIPAVSVTAGIPGVRVLDSTGGK